MKLNFKMPELLKVYYKNELSLYQQALEQAKIKDAWHHLERAHIIGQRYPYQHTETHGHMLFLGLKSGDFKEVVGQMIRLMLGAPFSIINKIPVGNVGSTRVSMIKSQEIPKDIKNLFVQFEN